MSSPPGPRVDIAVCETHGLRYNRAVESGCVRCRRESGAAPATGAAPARTKPAARRTDAPASAPLQLLFAALLVGATGALCWSAHQAVLDSFTGGLLAKAGRAGSEAAAAPGEAYGSDTTAPAAWPPGAQPQATAPPGMRGRGPAEQQKQLEKVLRQMQEEQAKERQAAAPADELPQ
jgi:hypothetical protein